MDYLIVGVPLAGLLIAIWYDCVSEVRTRFLVSRVDALEAKIATHDDEARKQLALLANRTSPQNLQEAAKTLLEIHQRRMDRCQTEQIWAIAAYIAVTSFVLSNEKLFLANQVQIKKVYYGFGVLAFFAAGFLLTRLRSYYLNRLDFARAVQHLPGRPDYMATDANLSVREMLMKRAGKWPALWWLLTYALVIYLPFFALHLIATK